MSSIAVRSAFTKAQLAELAGSTTAATRTKTPKALQRFTRAPAEVGE
jgi:hypothetical protein